MNLFRSKTSEPVTSVLGDAVFSYTIAFLSLPNHFKWVGYVSRTHSLQADDNEDQYDLKFLHSFLSLDGEGAQQCDVKQWRASKHLTIQQSTAKKLGFLIACSKVHVRFACAYT